ncbi:hypothetical protein ACP70R_015186 [Stipagrostis hirtigluma subsp. patula]
MSSLVGGWSAALERIRWDCGRLLLDLAPSSSPASATRQDEDREGGGGTAVPVPPRGGPSDTGRGGDGAVPPAETRRSGLGAETALSILVDCFGH